MFKALALTGITVLLSSFACGSINPVEITPYTNIPSIDPTTTIATTTTIAAAPVAVVEPSPVAPPPGYDQMVKQAAIVKLVAIEHAAQSGDRQAAASLVALTFPEDPRRAISIAQRESGLRCNARNPRSSASGLMQTLSLHAPRAQRMGMTWQQVQTSCLANLTLARALYDESGWRPWRV